jgi:aspartyl-tRNA(Asn)/glutamyl-tRNA(Gln) amidotransferase subunit A
MIQKPSPAYSQLLKSEGPVKIAYFKQYIESEGLDAEIKSYVLQLIEKLRAAGHTVEELEFPYLDYVIPAYYVLTTAEASSNLSRFDGIHYGYRSKNATDLESTYKLSRTEGFGKEVKRRIMLGTFVLSSDQYNAYYNKAQKVRRVIQDQTNEVLADVDAILIPTTSTPAFKLGEKSKDPIAMYLADLFTVQANLAGNPAISLPLFETKAGLPIGIQLMGKSFQEQELFNLSQLLVETCSS